MCITLCPLIFFHFLECAKLFPSGGLYSSCLLSLRDSALHPSPASTASIAIPNSIESFSSFPELHTAALYSCWIILLSKLKLAVSSISYYAKLVCLALPIDCCLHLFSFSFYLFVEQNLSKSR